MRSTCTSVPAGLEYPLRRTDQRANKGRFASWPVAVYGKPCSKFAGFACNGNVPDHHVLDPRGTESRGLPPSLLRRDMRNPRRPTPRWDALRKSVAIVWLRRAQGSRLRGSNVLVAPDPASPSACIREDAWPERTYVQVGRRAAPARRPARFSRVSAPPWASAIWRDSTRPMPEPSGLVVKKGTNRLARARAGPGPRPRPNLDAAARVAAAPAHAHAAARLERGVGRVADQVDQQLLELVGIGRGA